MCIRDRSLFHEGYFRKTQKSILFEVFVNDDEQLDTNNYTYVIDGGMLLYRIQWNQNDSFQCILNKYVTYVQSHFGSDVIVVFDGYANNSRSTKASERIRRSNNKKCCDVFFTENMNATTTTQDKFLSNINNKKRLISMLANYLAKENILVKQDIDDADLLIVKTAIEHCFKNVVVVADDIDILVLLTALTPKTKTIYYLKLGKGKNESFFF